ncbi:MAG: type I-MYXAN CRISPR-associated protein Cas6/Cmx6 [Sulfuricellaceae bacterium]|nr:type I-MYXAN CRISPR-associated protein Cas6/Cmx6 [Sulfuricellaceae bacterium]
MIDAVFSVEGKSMPIDHGYRLLQEIVRVLPWLRDEENVGIIPIHGAATEHGNLLLSRRATITLRIKRTRIDDAKSLTGQRLNIGEDTLLVGPVKLRELHPYVAIHSPYVTNDHNDEISFMDEIHRELQEMGIRCRMVCGKPHVVDTGNAKVVAYSLALYDLPPDKSLLLLERGLGKNRKIGCGVFVPHKSFAPVGG